MVFEKIVFNIRIRFGVVSRRSTIIMNNVFVVFRAYILNLFRDTNLSKIRILRFVIRYIKFLMESFEGSD